MRLNDSGVHLHSHDGWVDIFGFLVKNFNKTLYGIKDKIFIHYDLLQEFSNAMSILQLICFHFDL